MSEVSLSEAKAQPRQTKQDDGEKLTTCCCRQLHCTLPIAGMLGNHGYFNKGSWTSERKVQMSKTSLTQQSKLGRRGRTPGGAGTATRVHCTTLWATAASRRCLGHTHPAYARPCLHMLSIFRLSYMELSGPKKDIVWHNKLETSEASEQHAQTGKCISRRC